MWVAMVIAMANHRTLWVELRAPIWLVDGTKMGDPPRDTDIFTQQLPSVRMCRAACCLLLLLLLVR